MRLIVARCEVVYTGRLTAVLPEALRLVMVKSDGSVMVHADTGGELAGLENALDRAERLLTQLEDPSAQDALGDRYLTVFRERREQRDRAAEALGRARADAGRDTLPDVETLRGAWDRMNVKDRRELLGLRFHALALSRDRSLVVYPAGADVGDLPTRGFKREPVLEPFPTPPSGARLLAL